MTVYCLILITIQISYWLERVMGKRIFDIEFSCFRSTVDLREIEASVDYALDASKFLH